MSDNSLFFRTAELSNILKHLKSEERMLSDKLRNCEGYEATADCSSDHCISNTDASQHFVDELERLKELRADAWEATAELESLFHELAKSEFARIESLMDAVPGRDLGAACSAAVHAAVARYVQGFGSLLSKNNNVAYLLLEFSSLLDPSDQSDSRKGNSNRPDVSILGDEDGSRCRGVRVDEIEVRFIDIEMAFDEFQSTVLKAIENWRRSRLVRVERRAKLRKEL